jgi:acyl carrier protein
MSTETTTTDEVLAIIAGVLEIGDERVRQQPTLAAHDWNSLTSLEALAQVENHFGITLNLSAFHAARTLDDLVALVERERAGSDGR